MTPGSYPPKWTVKTPVPALPSVEPSAETWRKHIVARHGEMAALLAQVLATLANHTVVVTGQPGTNNVVFVNQDIMKTAGVPFVVVVNQPRAFVGTALYDRRFRTIKRERILWAR